MTVRKLKIIFKTFKTFKAENHSRNGFGQSVTQLGIQVGTQSGNNLGHSTGHSVNYQPTIIC